MYSIVLGRRRYFKIFGAVTLVMASGLLAYRYQHLLVSSGAMAGSIVIQGHRHLTNTEILNITGLQSGIEMGQVDPSALEAILLNIPRVHQASVQIRWPDKVIITITETMPAAVLHTPSGIYEVDEGLKILSKNNVRAKDIPVIGVPGEIEGVRYTGRLRERLESFVSQVGLLRKNFPVVFSWISDFMFAEDGRVQAYLIGRPMVVEFGLDVDALKLRKLHASLSYFQQTNAYPPYLDLSGADAVF